MYINIYCIILKRHPGLLCDYKLPYILYTVQCASTRSVSSASHAIPSLAWHHASESDAPSWGTYTGEGQEDAHSHQHARGHSAALKGVADAVVRAVEAALVRLYRRLVQHHGGQHDCAEHTQKHAAHDVTHKDLPGMLCCSAWCTFFFFYLTCIIHTEYSKKGKTAALTVIPAVHLSTSYPLTKRKYTTVCLAFKQDRFSMLAYSFKELIIYAFNRLRISSKQCVLNSIS